MSDDLPSSGEPGVRPPMPGSLPRPAMWPDGIRDAPFRVGQDDSPPPPSPTKRTLAWVAVAAIVVGLILIGIAMVTTSWPIGIAGIVIAVLGAVVGLRAQIMEAVSVTDSPTGSA